MMLKLGLMGSGIARSRMPRLQQHLGSLAKVAVSYSLIDGEGQSGFDPMDQVKQLVADGFHGINVTHPYKQRVYNLVDRPVVSGHEAIGSYNTLKFEAGRILGANTDYSGFIRGYEYRRGSAAPGHVVLCGAGGVGRAVAFGLVALGATHISVFDLVETQAQSLSEALQQRGASSSVVPCNGLAEACRDASGLVNCTALGMYNHPGSAFPESAIGSQQWAFDAVYTPLETGFISRCRASGIQCLSGFDLWIFQGIDAFRIFTDVEVQADESLMATALSWLD